MFPSGFPDFNADERRELKRLGVCEEQITELRHALIGVRSYVRQPAANNEVAAHLADIERLASELSRKLRTAVIPDAALMVEQRYWQQRPTDDGPTVGMHLCPRLDALTAAAVDAADAIPDNKPVRSRAGNPEPVRQIDEALVHGWWKAHGNTMRYPETLRPSVSTGKHGQGRAFPEIVGICYAAVGYKSQPKRAIQAYVKAKNGRRREVLAAINAALSERE